MKLIVDNTPQWMKNMALWVSSALLVMVTIALGVINVMNYDADFGKHWVSIVKLFNYDRLISGDQIRFLIGSLEIISALLTIHPRTRFYGHATMTYFFAVELVAHSVLEYSLDYLDETLITKIQSLFFPFALALTLQSCQDDDGAGFHVDDDDCDGEDGAVDEDVTESSGSNDVTLRRLERVSDTSSTCESSDCSIADVREGSCKKKQQ